MHSRNIAVSSATSLLDRAILEFEKRPEIQKKRPALDMELEALKHDPKFMGILTASAKSVVLRLTELDVFGTDYVERYDKTEEGMIFMYRAARIIREELPKFMLFQERRRLTPGKTPQYFSDTGKFDPVNHKWFTMLGLDEGVRMLPSIENILGQEMYAEAKSTAKRWIDQGDEIVLQALSGLE